MTKDQYIRFLRSENSMEIMKRPKCFVLLAQIAQRAKRTASLNIQNLSLSEALIGDHKTIGLSESEYRTAKRQLEAFGLVKFRSTNRGTVAKLLDKTIFDINASADGNQIADRPRTDDGQGADRQRSADNQATTKKNDKKCKNEKNDKNGKNIKEYKIRRKNFLKKSAMPSPTYEDMLNAR